MTACAQAGQGWRPSQAARTLLSFGGDVEVVSPAAVRADLAGAAAEVIARYG